MDASTRNHRVEAFFIQDGTHKIQRLSGCFAPFEVNIQIEKQLSGGCLLNAGQGALVRIKIGFPVDVRGDLADQRQAGPAVRTRIRGNVEPQGFLRNGLIPVAVSTQRTFQLPDFFHQAVLGTGKSFQLNLTAYLGATPANPFVAGEQAYIKAFVRLRVRQNTVDELPEQRLVFNDLIGIHTAKLIMETPSGDLYHKLILELNRSPLYFEKRPDASVVVDAVNPLCGDKFKLYLTVENQTIVGATFHGYGCAVSKASTSVLMKKIQGRPVAEVLSVIREFLSRINPKGAVNPTMALPDDETTAFLPVKHFPGRLKCATLSWETLADFLANHSHTL